MKTWMKKRKEWKSQPTTRLTLHHRASATTQQIPTNDDDNDDADADDALTAVRGAFVSGSSATTPRASFESTQRSATFASGSGGRRSETYPSWQTPCCCCPGCVRARRGRRGTSSPWDRPDTRPPSRRGSPSPGWS